MVIRISRDVMISATDGICYDIKVRKVRTKEDGSKMVVWKSAGYYGNLKQAAVGVLNKSLATGETVTSIEALIKRLDSIETRIMEVCAPAVNAMAASTIETAFGDEDFEGLFGDE